MMTNLWRTAAAAAVLAAAPLTSRADDPKPAATKPADKPAEKAAEKTPAEKVSAVRRGVSDAMSVAMKAQTEMQKAKDDEKADKQKAFQDALAEYRKAASGAGAKYAALAKEFPADPVALEAIQGALQSGGNAKAKDLYAIVKQHHLKSPKLGGFVMFLSRDDSPASADLLREIAAASPTRDVKGQATLALGLQLKGQLIGYSSKPTEEQIGKVMPEAEKYLSDAAKEYADVKFGRDTVGATAAKELIGLRNIPNLQVGKLAPAAACKDLDGKDCKLSDLKGKVVVMDIWATWCGPCRAMIPHEREMVKHLEGKPFALVSVSCDDKKEALTKFLEKEKMPWTHWWNGSDGGISSEWNVQAFPTIYVIDHKGVIRFKNVRDKALSKAVEELVKEAEAAKAPAGE